MLGERYRALEVLPAVTVDASAGMLMFPDASARPLRRHRPKRRAAARGHVEPRAAGGVRRQPATLPFSVAAGARGRPSVSPSPRRGPPPGARCARSRRSTGSASTAGLRRIEHPHIPIQTWLPPATVQLMRGGRWPTPSARIGYFPGPGDEVAGRSRVRWLRRDAALGEAICATERSRASTPSCSASAPSTSTAAGGPPRQADDYVAAGGTAGRAVQHQQPHLQGAAGASGPSPSTSARTASPTRPRRSRPRPDTGARRAQPHRRRRLRGLGAGARASTSPRSGTTATPRRSRCTTPARRR